MKTSAGSYTTLICKEICLLTFNLILQYLFNKNTGCNCINKLKYFNKNHRKGGGTRNKHGRKNKIKLEKGK